MIDSKRQAWNPDFPPPFPTYEAKPGYANFPSLSSLFVQFLFLYLFHSISLFLSRVPIRSAFWSELMIAFSYRDDEYSELVMDVGHLPAFSQISG
jgi:hypothetical protein